LLAGGKYYVHDLPGSFNIFYYTSGKYAGRLGTASYSYPYSYAYDRDEHCYRLGQGFDDVGIIVSEKEICSRSDSRVQARRTYPNSKISLFLLGSRQ
jgi:hypothetical protein